VRANEKQAVFTGKQQRDGVAILPFIVAGLFGQDGDQDADGAFAAEHEAERAAAVASADAAGYDADADDDAAAKVGKNFVFNWQAYHDVWGDTPMHVAVTSMFAEYAVLYARIAGRTTSAVPPAMTMAEGLAMGEQAKMFVTKFVTPILGHIASVKMHKLLCHVADAIQWHGNVQNGNTAENESEHKADKPFYARTNKEASAFTRQLVRHAHGARTILARHAEEDRAAAASWRATLAERATAAAMAAGDAPAAHGGAAAAAAAVAGAVGGEPAPHGGGAVDAATGGAAAAAVAGAVGGAPAPHGGVAADAATAGAAAAAAGLACGAAPSVAMAAQAERNRKQNKRVYNAARVSVRDLASRPDLANVGALLNMAADHHVRVPTRTPIEARFDCGTRVRQLLRAADDYLGAPWYDAVLYRPGADESRVCIGELRAIVRGSKGDAVVLVAMQVVPAEPLCPFAARGCVRLKWHVADNASDVTLRLVPADHVRRLALVVPDFADLAHRRGVDADLPAMDGPLQDRLDMRFFLNVFFPWDVK